MMGEMGEMSCSRRLCCRAVLGALWFPSFSMRFANRESRTAHQMLLVSHAAQAPARQTIIHDQSPVCCQSPKAAPVLVFCIDCIVTPPAQSIVTRLKNTDKRQVPFSTFNFEQLLMMCVVGRGRLKSTNVQRRSWGGQQRPKINCSCTYQREKQHQHTYNLANPAPTPPSARTDLTLKLPKAKNPTLLTSFLQSSFPHVPLPQTTPHTPRTSHPPPQHRHHVAPTGRRSLGQRRRRHVGPLRGRH
jgi:hypothetical protein